MPSLTTGHTDTSTTSSPNSLVHMSLPVLRKSREQPTLPMRPWQQLSSAGAITSPKHASSSAPHVETSLGPRAAHHFQTRGLRPFDNNRGRILVRAPQASRRKFHLWDYESHHRRSRSNTVFGGNRVRSLSSFGAHQPSVRANVSSVWRFSKELDLAAHVHSMEPTVAVSPAPVRYFVMTPSNRSSGVPGSCCPVSVPASSGYFPDWRTSER